MTYYEQLNQKARRTAKRNGVLFSLVDNQVSTIIISEKLSNMFQCARENRKELSCIPSLHIPIFLAGAR